MRQRVVGGFLALVAALPLAGCEMAPSAGTAPDPRAAVEGALDALAGQTAVAYRLPETTLNVTKSGLVRGSLPLKGQQVQAFQAGGDLYLLASPAYWQAQGMPADRAGEYGARWARSVLAFDPGLTLSPAAVAQTLRTVLPPDAQAARVLPENGTEVFDIAGLRVTAVQPYRVVSIEPTLLGAAVAQALGTTSMGVEELPPEQLAALRATLGKTVDGLGQPFVAGPVVATTVTGNTLRCSLTGDCSDTVQVENTLLGDAPKALARLVLRSSVTSSRLGERGCEQELITSLNGSAGMACSVTFALPNMTGTAKVSAVPSVTAEPVATIDPDGLKRQVAAALGG
jgi:hypothetical protein